MGQSEENNPQDNMNAQVICISLLALAAVAAAQKPTHNLPVLFQYEEPGHSVAVFRGAELKQAIAAGLVPGFGSRSGKKIDTSATDRAAARAAADARAAAARAAADARAAAAAAARPSQLELAEQACVQACSNLAGQCRN